MLREEALSRSIPSRPTNDRRKRNLWTQILGGAPGRGFCLGTIGRGGGLVSGISIELKSRYRSASTDAVSSVVHCRRERLRVLQRESTSQTYTSAEDELLLRRLRLRWREIPSLVKYYQEGYRREEDQDDQ